MVETKRSDQAERDQILQEIRRERRQELLEELDTIVIDAKAYDEERRATTTRTKLGCKNAARSSKRRSAERGS